MASEGSYYVPEQSKWPIIASIALFLTVYGAGNMMNDMTHGTESNVLFIFFVGALMVAYFMYGWFAQVVQESRAGMYSEQMDRSFRWGMGWFIFSEVMFFGAFFGALFYARNLSVPWLGGMGDGVSTHEVLWPAFEATWPVFQNPDNVNFPGPKETIPAWGIPLLNTILLVTSSFTATFAHHALKKNNRKLVKIWLAVTVLLGAIFLYYQAHEYVVAYTELGLTLESGIYGTTFFMLTGFHGAHVTIGTLMLAIMLIRVIKGHFDADNHFAFEAVCWYWHFVDVVWIGLFIFVYVV